MLFQRLKLSLIALDIIITQFFIQKEKIWKKKKENVGKDKTKCLFNIILHIITGILFADQEATVRTGHRTTDWFQTGKGEHQGCILSPCLFNLHAEYIMRNAGLDETQAGIKITG